MEKYGVNLYKIDFCKELYNSLQLRPRECQECRQKKRL